MYSDSEVLVPAGVVIRRRTVRIGRVIIEVGGVDGRIDRRLDGRWQRPIAQALPVETIKPSAHGRVK